ncbi:hypothetical protein A2335_05105 [Candidatus Peregrinibacteria bacterium RIFOXYB2_FULL_32_7]|nr:MAG: hypothetical protein A2335_05105 [Candidatus Peregrinibacteria bacterium RIFOXYB2_FULL_32_7]
MQKQTFSNYIINKFFPTSHHKHWGIIIAIFLTAITLTTFNAETFQVSLMGALQEEIEFNGTVYPFKDTYLWSNMEYQDWKGTEENVYQKYDVNKIKTTFPEFNSTKYLESLEKSSAEASNYWNTYLVPYKFTYESTPNGSHPGTDIRGTRNMTIYSISNGEVTKVKDSDGTVCIKTPEINFEGQNQSFHVCYLHLEFRTVAQGDIVQKGQQIGGVGDKGFATTPHLHLQIDKDTAPWHPYWPFSSAEAATAGLSFMEAVNSGLGFENIEKYTIDPMDFIQKYLDKDANFTGNVITDADKETNIDTADNLSNEIATNENSENNSSDNEINSENENSTTNEISTIPEEINKNKVKFLSLETPNYYPGSKQKLEICNLDQDKQLTHNLPANQIFLETTKGKVEFEKNEFTRSDFENGCVKTTFIPSKENNEIITIYAHDVLSEIKGSIDISKFEFKDVNESTEGFEAILYAFANGITTGYPDQTFKPENSVTRIESVAFVLRALEFDPITNPQFDLPDVSDQEWYSGLLAKAMQEGMVSGYPDGTIKPENQVIGAEILKIFLEAFADVHAQKENEQWYERFVEYAKENNLINENFDPAKPMDRLEVIEIIYKAKDLM